MRIGEVLVTAEEIDTKLAEIGAAITRDYQGRDLLIIGVLKGAYVVMADLARYIDIPLEMDFMAISSYGAATKSSGVVRILKDLDQEIADRHVLIIEDIVDTGLTLQYLINGLGVGKAGSIGIAAVVIKDGVDRRPLDIKYGGFHIPPEFVLGYGLDVDGKYRNLPYIAVVEDYP